MTHHNISRYSTMEGGGGGNTFYLQLGRFVLSYTFIENLYIVLSCLIKWLSFLTLLVLIL